MTEATYISCENARRNRVFIPDTIDCAPPTFPPRLVLVSSGSHLMLCHLEMDTRIAGQSVRDRQLATEVGKGYIGETERRPVKDQPLLQQTRSQAAGRIS